MAQKTYDELIAEICLWLNERRPEVAKRLGISYNMLWRLLSGSRNMLPHHHEAILKLHREAHETALARLRATKP